MPKLFREMNSDFFRFSQCQVGIFRGVAKNEAKFFASLQSLPPGAVATRGLVERFGEPRPDALPDIMAKVPRLIRGQGR